MLDQPILFIATAMPDDSKAFYTEVMGFSLVADEDFALVFDADGNELRIQKVPTHTPQPYTAMGWVVTDIESAMKALVSRGARVEQYDAIPQTSLGVWEIPGVAKIAWFRDPDGNTLSLTERLGAD